MNIMGLLSKIIFVLGMVFFSSQLIAQNGQIQFKTKIVKGTCEFDDNSELDKYIDFSQNGTLIASDVDNSPINKPIQSENFSYTIVCKNFPANSDKTIKVKSKSAASTQFNNGVFFGLTDTTKTGFLLESCDNNNQNCQAVSDGGVSSFPSTTSDSVVVNYRVSLVKRENNVKPGDASAAVTFEYYQD
ncbi:MULTISPECIES: fimbrial protein [Providencia]|uniref:Type 1 fimbrial protein n=1 Tax=Providencia rettgeri TaxID=587 RepID=A0A427HB87_PRORE|nr:MULTISPECIES: type 1 fimbrial protein [Providencia]ELR5075902.1 type 1 fimbrial protein [Providencia stuartii]ELR5071565.1 type 1 fimbrial protein [Providencia rettgeri]ELR5219764.1 type 1 fimbrial protein [Providencia rettgeri]ELR5223911.1 type 1 fimbrial protein [Providencia rettgeri]MBV2188798.1 type 1 fimbrial protein [Providencia rettgeri]